MMRIECTHGSRLQVAIAGGIAIDIICESCFAGARPLYLQSLRNQTELSSSLECVMCGNSPSRLSKDFGRGICDTCFDRSKTCEENFSATKPRKPIPPIEIDPGSVFIGPKESAMDAAELIKRNIRRVIVCCTSIPMYVSDTEELTFLRIPIADSLDQNLLPYLQVAMEFIEEGVRGNSATLVHCNAGVSRSGSVVVAWLMHKYGISTDEALDIARSKRDIITPNSNFLSQLKSWQCKV